MDVFAAIADDVRRRIVVLLAQSPRTAGALAEQFPDISRPAVSRHLRVLRESGLVRAELVGRERRYELATEPLAEVDRWLALARGQAWEQRLDAFETEVRRTVRDRRTARPATQTTDTRSTG
ncbi:ArsR/SmtB family transcription factor [Luteipulveratus halotolerans]|uniref:ArsR family transcriptional regulator n=1 Tax=Luteipulveratus halotolerans TaxID=1631356 RepID=A0A0L6CMA8_9MICO|nr:metalloregulator ArsR/SmtB family transcription factor [Luteipulveratus halotolerans]KNX38931.1 ArsR family transcriptional regulator [Luteipulveratus halotolerans]